MGERIAVGDKLPFFLYDTPYSARNRFRDLLAAKSPLVLVFMANFGHPITRTFAGRYAQTYSALRDGSMALVVRSRADKLSTSIGPDTLPYPLLCDADGVLYEFLDIPQNSSTLMTYSLEGWRILREAKKQGYRAAKGSAQQLPLTLILDADGTVLFCHYGASLTDVPEDCAAMQSLLEELDLTPDLPSTEAAEAFNSVYSKAQLPDQVPPAPGGNVKASADTPRPRRRRRPNGSRSKPAPIQEYGTPDLAKTAVVNLFDDPYEDD